LEVGNGDLTLAEQRSHFTLWCLIKSPLLLGNDLRNMPKDVLDIITNEEVIALNQDPLGVQGYKRSSKVVKKFPNHLRHSRNHNIDVTNFDVEYDYTNEDDQEDDSDETVEVWAGDLNGGDIAVVLFNRSSQTQKITATFEEIGLVFSSITGDSGDTSLSSSAKVRDLWAHKDLGVHDNSFSAMVESHDVVALRLTPVTHAQMS
jgi:alpha-galactosidase